jgi:dethiobiotin synthetase
MTTGFVVTGTDTGIGKTVFAAALAGWLGAHYWKPVQAGLDDETDSDIVARLSGLGQGCIIPEAYRLNTPCSPHQAAAIDGTGIDPERLNLPVSKGVLVVEGAGGVLVPLNDEVLFADMFARWALPVILVARTELGTINHSLLSLEALRTRKVMFQGIVFIGDENAESERVICAFGNTVHLGRLPQIDPLNAETLAATFTTNIRTELLR